MLAGGEGVQQGRGTEYHQTAHLKMAKIVNFYAIYILVQVKTTTKRKKNTYIKWLFGATVPGCWGHSTE
jgi:hypothetical protein